MTRVIIGIMLLYAFDAIADTSTIGKLNVGHYCAFKRERPPSQITYFDPDPAAIKAVQRITKMMGLTPRFEIRAADVANAAAVIEGNKRFILYNPDFMETVNTSIGSNWPEISILAHEIAHHLNNHTLENNGSRPDTELEADQFSGFILQKMGASLSQAKLAMQELADDKPSSTHPGKRTRIVAIASGWRNARGGVEPSPPSNIHNHNKLQHSHELSSLGLNHSHFPDLVIASRAQNSQTSIFPTAGNLLETSPATPLHSHNGRKHSHPLPATGLTHEHAQQLAVNQARPVQSRAPEPEMVAIPGGHFMMGSPVTEAGRDNDERAHQITVGEFSMGKYEVTVGEFRRFVESAGYRTDAEKNADGKQGCYAFNGKEWAYTSGRSWKNPGFSQNDRHPVTCVSQRDASAYAKWLSKETGKSYNLPTEAQWEYAARAGTKTARYWGDSPDQACRSANVADQSAKRVTGWGDSWTTHNCNDNQVYTSPVGRYATNRWGLLDMMGNVLEWTCSEYDKDYGGSERQCTTTNDSVNRVLRGGGSGYSPTKVRSAYRAKDTATGRSLSTGFRISSTP